MQGLPHHFNSMEGEKVVLFGIIISLFLWASGRREVAEALLEYNVDNGCFLFRM